MDRIQEIVQAIGRLKPREKQKLWRLLVEEGHLSEQYTVAAPSGKQPELLSSSSARRRSPDYVLTFDGGSKGNPGWGYGSYAITRVQDGSQRVERLDLGDNCTNNEAEYDTLITALEDVSERVQAAGKRPADFTVEVRGDSNLVLRQVRGDWKAKDERMRYRRDVVRSLLSRFGGYRLVEQPREKSVKVLGH